jgi:hypothetical protein
LENRRQIKVLEDKGKERKGKERKGKRRFEGLTLSNPIFLPTAYSLALICFGRERGWWITCNYPTVLKEGKHGETERVQPALSVG